MRLIILLICLSGCMSVKQHESEMYSVERRWRNRIGLMDAKLRNKEEKYVVLKEAYDSLEEDYSESKREILEKEGIVDQHAQVIEELRKKLEEASSRIDLLSAEVEANKKEVEAPKVKGSEDFGLLDGNATALALGKLELFKGDNIICDERDIGCYAEALIGKKSFRKVMIDRLHKQRGFMSDGEIEKLRKSVLKAGKGKKHIACNEVPLSEGGTHIGRMYFRNDDRYSNVGSHWSFQSNSASVRNKKTWEQLQFASSLCLEFIVKSVRTNYRTWSGIRKSINVYAKPVKAWIVKNNDQTYPLKGKIYKSMFTTKHAKSNVCCRDEMRMIHRFLKR